MFEEPLRELATPTVSNGSLVADLRFLALWHAAIAVDLGRQGGDRTRAISIAHVASVLEVSAALRSFEADTRRRQRFRLWRSSTGLHASRALAYGWASDALWIGSVLTANDATGLFNAEDSAVAHFVLAVLAHWVGKDPESHIQRLPTEYAALIRGVNSNPSTFDAALVSACEARMKWAADERELAPVGQLADMAYAVWPVEFLALLQLRHRLGHPVTGVEHPLMSMPMGSLEDFANYQIVEPWLNELRARLNPRCGRRPDV